MLVKCDQCGVEFYRVPSQFERSKQHFCSLKCARAKKRDPVVVVCHNCGKPFLVNVWRVKVSKSKQFFCSKKCRFPPSQVNCDFCGKEFYKGFFEIKSTKQNFCSKKCYVTSKKRGENMPCAECGKVIYRRASAIKNFAFCSNACFTKFNGKALHLKKVGNFPTRKEVCALLAKVKSMSHQEVQTTIKETPR